MRTDDNLVYLKIFRDYSSLNYNNCLPAFLCVYGHNPVTVCACLSILYIGKFQFQSMCFLEMHSSARSSCMCMEHLGIHMCWIRAVHQGWCLVWAVSSNRKSCTPAGQRPRSALCSTGGTRAPPAHWDGRNWGQKERQIMGDRQSQRISIIKGDINNI